MIEVERKFLLTQDTRDRLSSLGGILTARKHLHDTYYDTGEHLLVQQDHWLRKRNGHWELKCHHHLHSEQEEDSVSKSECRNPEDKYVLQDTNDSESILQDTDKSVLQDTNGRKGVLKETDQYREETNEDSILAHLDEVFRIRTKTMGMSKVTPGAIISMDTLLECGVLVPLVEVSCVRECYVLRGGEMTGEKGVGCEEVKVDLDECVCGEEGRYGVGEVEIMVSSPSDVESAADKCRDLALQLGEYQGHAGLPRKLSF